MHMADALLTPTVGAVMWSATAAVTAYSARKVQEQADNKKIPLMGVLGAFVFAVQMVNFAIPGTGSSGHLGGGLLLAVLLGPHAAFLTLSSVLTVQALFFADGGLLALGSNIFNLGFFPCFIAYPLVYRSLTRNSLTQGTLITGSILAAVVGLQLGAVFVVLQTFLSGITALPFTPFLMVMLPVHLAIGLVEGIATAGIISFLWNNRPELISNGAGPQPVTIPYLRYLIFSFLAITVLTGGFFSWYASDRPDGLEWSIEKVTGGSEVEASQDLHEGMNRIQQKTAIMPYYTAGDNISKRTASTLSGLLGGTLVLILSVSLGYIFKRRTPSR
jgi:cobalt/nickel transport system permease protein